MPENKSLKGCSGGLSSYENHANEVAWFYTSILVIVLPCALLVVGSIPIQDK